MSFKEDLNLLQSLLADLNAVLSDSGRAVQPLAVLALHRTLASLVRNYKYTVRDATVMQPHFIGAELRDHKTRTDVVCRLQKSIKTHGVYAVVCFCGDLFRMLLDLNMIFEQTIKPLARAAIVRRPTMIYDYRFTYRSIIYDENANGPIARLDRILSKAYEVWYSYDFDTLGRHGTINLWRSQSRFLTIPPVYTYDQGKFFGPATRTTQMVCFRYFTEPTIQDADCVVFRMNRFQDFVASVEYEPETQELKHSTDVYSRDSGYRFGIVCEEPYSNTGMMRVSLAASVHQYDTAYGFHVTKTDWIDAACIRSEKMRYASGLRTCPTTMKYMPFPYNMYSSYKTWHIVMGNNCRLKVRVSSLHRGRVVQENRWTVANTDGHADFDQCCYILQEYYGFQGLGGAVHPLDRKWTDSFVAAYQHRIANLHWLVNAYAERPSYTGTPPVRIAVPQTSNLIHAMMLKAQTQRFHNTVEYLRYDTICSEQ